MPKNTPLAVLLRPKTLDEIVGQEHLVGKDAKLRKLIEADKLASIILFGPSGTGKTTLANVIALHTKSKFINMNATQATVKEIRKYGQAAEKSGERTLIFLDEIHRASSVQQDAFLPFTENGQIILIGATISNPFHSVGSAIISRSQMICELEPLKPSHLALVLKRAITYYRSCNISVRLSKDAAMYIITVANGDARKAVSILEVAVAVADNANEPEITLELAKAVSPSKHMVFNAQAHYDLASWMQGAIQASDPDSAVYALAMALESGEDPRYIARRILVSASEDASGNPFAALVAHSAYVAACTVGRPECDIVLSHAVVTIASSPRNKSAACAIWAALKDIHEGISIEVPKEMKDSHYAGSKQLGHGEYHDGMNMSKYIGVRRRYYRPEDWQK